MNETTNLNDPAIESPKRTALILAIADQLAIPHDEISEIILGDALESDPIHPYDALPDREGIDPKTTFIALIESLIGYDDDHDDAAHDIDHATNNINPCDEHPTICSTCCELH